MRDILGLAVVLALFSALWLWLSTKNTGIFVEHGPMENFQAICIALGFLLFVWELFTLRSAERVFIASLALFYATFLVVEFDTRELGWHAAAAVLNGAVRNISLLVLWLLIGLWAFGHRRALIHTGRTWLWSAAGLLLVASGAFWIAGGIVDKLKFFGAASRNLLMEELLETNAALLMLLAAIVVLGQAGKRTLTAPSSAACPADLPRPQDSGH